jgi:signal transduction histidine kinase
MTERLRERQELESRLSAAEKRAEIGHLASGLAHEIKNPLNALSLGLDVLRRRHKPEAEAPAADYVQRIGALREEIDRLAALINNFLAYGRPLALNRTAVDLAGIAEATVSDLGETAAQVGVTISAELDGGLPRAVADGSLVKSALWNLVQNAVQEMEAKGGTLRVVLRRSPAEGPPRAEILVEDDGPGIAPADLPNLFEPYFSRKDGGVGLGLAMVKRIVEEHGGSVSAENREEGGARFRLLLPLPAG